ncbi:MAG: hypothetical protein AVDCRST_MAG41-3882, partial [uncultured Corynebacteriales bacterium]
PAARSIRPAARWARAARASRSARAASSRSSARSSRYPPGQVLTEPAPGCSASRRRRPATCACRALRAVAGGASAQIPSIRVSTVTTWLACTSRIASSVRCRRDRSGSTWPARRTSTGPRIPNSTARSRLIS